MKINPNATWIDVNEYMPPDNKKVIVRAINKENETFYYGAYFSYIDNSWYFIAIGDSSTNLTVTHWMKEPEVIEPLNLMREMTKNQQMINAMGMEPPRNIYDVLSK